MNLQEQKSFEEILGYLEGKKKILLTGCGGCSTIFHTGGIRDIDEMADRLTKEGKEIVGKIGMPFGVFACYLPMASLFYKEHKEEIKACDAILNQSCGDGMQAMREYLEEEMDIVNAIRRSIQFIKRYPLHTIFFLVFSIIMITVADGLLLLVPFYPQYLVMIVNTLFILPFSIIMLAHMYISKYSIVG